jgi:hypothetical protein
MGSAEGDPRAMSKRTTAERTAIKRAKLAAAAAQAAVNPFDAAYGDRPITPEAAYWDDRGYMHWQLPTNERGSRLAFSRNFANPTNI